VAPEILLQEEGEIGKTENIDLFKADAWSFGAVLFTYLFGIPPFYSSKQGEYVEMLRLQYRKQAKIELEDLELLPNKSLADFVYRLLEVDPARRMGLKEAIEHDYFKSLEVHSQAQIEEKVYRKHYGLLK